SHTRAEQGDSGSLPADCGVDWALDVADMAVRACRCMDSGATTLRRHANCCRVEQTDPEEDEWKADSPRPNTANGLRCTKLLPIRRPMSRRARCTARWRKHTGAKRSDTRPA